jgi:hypothetical protein
MTGEKHNQLQDIAIGWLYKNGCDIFSKECQLPNGEIADAIGVKFDFHRQVPKVIDGQTVYVDEVHDKTFYIEAKASRSDLICQKQKAVYHHSLLRPVADVYYLIVADGITVEDDLYPEWGVIGEDGFVRRKAKRMKRDYQEQKLTQKSIERVIAHSLVYRVYGKLYL